MTEIKVLKDLSNVIYAKRLNIFLAYTDEVLGLEPGEDYHLNHMKADIKRDIAYYNLVLWIFRQQWDTVYGTGTPQFNKKIFTVT